MSDNSESCDEKEATPADMKKWSRLAFKDYMDSEMTEIPNDVK